MDVAVGSFRHAGSGILSKYRIVFRYASWVVGVFRSDDGRMNLSEVTQ